MIMVRRLVLALCCGTLLLGATGVPARDTAKAGDVDIHYSAVGTNMLNADIASQYGVRRGKDRALLSITAVKPAAATNGLGESTPLRVDAMARGGDGQSRPVVMREIRVAERFHYIGEFPVRDEETVEFSVEVTPPGQTQPTRLVWEQQFFVEP